MGRSSPRTMKTIHSNAAISIPDGVEVSIKSRVVSVTGPRGSLQKNFRHMDVDIKHDKAKNVITVEKWFGKKKELAAIKTVCSHIENLFTGVIKGFKYRMKLVYAHFPVMNFIGQKVKFGVDALEGVKLIRDAKDQGAFTVEGNDIENVSRTCALISQSCKVRNKDFRKFLDEIYVS